MVGAVIDQDYDTESRNAEKACHTFLSCDLHYSIVGAVIDLFFTL